jgi:pyridoxine 5'-phosphate synthase PdxJ
MLQCTVEADGASVHTRNSRGNVNNVDVNTIKDITHSNVKTGLIFSEVCLFQNDLTLITRFTKCFSKQASCPKISFSH